MPELPTNEGLRRVGPTAWMIAYRRTFTDIPFSAEIFSELERLLRFQGISKISKEFKSTTLVPQIEARYKLVDRLVQHSGTEQILEVAAGLSPRGMQFTQDPKHSYVEVDLPAVASQKRKIIEKLRPSNNNLHVVDGDALDLESLTTAAELFDPTKPIAIINEGLLRYLTFEQKAIVAQNVRSLLARFGGIWITPDITTKKILKSEARVLGSETEEAIRRVTGIDVEQNRFQNTDEAQSFFEDLGFTVERHEFMEVYDDLVSPKRFGKSQEDVEDTIGDASVFVMRLAPIK